MKTKELMKKLRAMSKYANPEVFIAIEGSSRLQCCTAFLVEEKQKEKKTITLLAKDCSKNCSTDRSSGRVPSGSVQTLRDGEGEKIFVLKKPKELI